MNNQTVADLKDLQKKYEKLCSISKSKEMQNYYIRLVNDIDDIIEDIKKED